MKNEFFRSGVCYKMNQSPNTSWSFNSAYSRNIYLMTNQENRKFLEIIEFSWTLRFYRLEVKMVSIFRQAHLGLAPQNSHFDMSYTSIIDFEILLNISVASNYEVFFLLRFQVPGKCVLFDKLAQESFLPHTSVW